MEKENLFRILNEWHWSLPIVVVFGLLILIHFCINVVYTSIYPRCVASDKTAWAVLMRILYKPFKLFLWFSGILILAPLYAHHFFEIQIIFMILNLLKVGIILALAWAFYICAEEAERYFLRKKWYDTTSIELFSKMSFLAILFVTLLLILPLFGIQIAGLLAFGGLSGIIVGFGAKDAIANVLGGFLLALDKPFKLGEQVTSLDKTIDGYVEHIGWRLTKIRTLDRKVLFIPNANFSTLVFVNASRLSHRRLLTKVGVRYEDIQRLPKLLEELESFIKTHKFVDPKEANYVNLIEFGESSLDIEIRAYTKTTNLLEFYKEAEQILIGVYEVIRRNGCELAVPTRVLRIEKEQGLPQ